MNLRRPTIALLAALALLSPLAAPAATACTPGPHCPMAAAMGQESPCHGASLQAMDCCLMDAAETAVEAAPVVPATASVAADAALSPRFEAGPVALSGTPAALPTRPLYRLFRALLI